MTSSDSSEPPPATAGASLDLERGLPVTPADVEALRRARQAASAMDSGAYLRFLAAQPQATPEELRARRGPCGPPFRLPGAREPGR